MLYEAVLKTNFDVTMKLETSLTNSFFDENFKVLEKVCSSRLYISRPMLWMPRTSLSFVTLNSFSHRIVVMGDCNLWVDFEGFDLPLVGITTDFEAHLIDG
jgi:hypothetical protein